MPFAAAYAGSKAGLARFADALRLALVPHGVRVTLAAPGFIAPDPEDSGKARRTGDVPVGIVAERIIRATMRGQARLITPWPFAVLRWVDRLLPRRLRDRVLLCLRLP